MKPIQNKALILEISNWNLWPLEIWLMNTK